MNNQQAKYVLDFFRAYNCFTNINDNVLTTALLQTPTDGRGLNKILGLNGSYISHELLRKVPKEVLTNIKRSNSSWIHNIIVEYDRCPVCNGVKNNLKNYTCSNSCANTYFRSGINNPNFNEYSPTAYVKICFSHHKKECIICGENNIVAVHHYDENHSNDSPENLIPLCPTHHQYFHSKYRSLIENKVDEYRNDFIKNKI